jgi:hypothetical protein
LYPPLPAIIVTFSKQMNSVERRGKSEERRTKCFKIRCKINKRDFHFRNVMDKVLSLFSMAMIGVFPTKEDKKGKKREKRGKTGEK